ncbi:MAG: response regulator [Myxococcales bacterium]|nr:response regulator [Myxococcales bacterium]
MDHDPEQLNVLVIDDDENVRRLLVDLVTSRGHQALPAGSAEEGMALLPIWTFQVAFLDQGLPGMEGLVLGEFLRKNNPDMTIALVTGEDEPRIERVARDLAITFIAKPFEVRQIQDVLDDAVSEALVRSARRNRQEDPDFAPPISRFVSEIEQSFEVPHLPERVAERVTSVVKRKLNDLRSVGRYTERDRVLALAGLLTARVLGIDLPKTQGGLTLYEEYDQIMQREGRRVEFEDG